MSITEQINFSVNNSIHYISFLFVVPKILFNESNLRLNQSHQTTILLNNKNEFPTIHIHYVKGFKFKKYIKEYIKDKYCLKNSNIIEIKLVNTFKKLHTYMIVIDSVKHLFNGTALVTIPKSSSDFGWRPFVDTFKLTNDNILKKEDLQKEIYKILYENINEKSYSYKLPIFKSSLVYKPFYSIDYKLLIQLLCNISTHKLV